MISICCVGFASLDVVCDELFEITSYGPSCDSCNGPRCELCLINAYFVPWMSSGTNHLWAVCADVGMGGGCL